MVCNLDAQVIVRVDDRVELYHSCRTQCSIARSLNHSIANYYQAFSEEYSLKSCMELDARAI